MNDPFSALNSVLVAVFHFESMRNGKYTNPDIQQLREAIDHYSAADNKSFIKLLKALRAALPKLKKWQISIEAIKSSMDALVKLHQMPAIDWDKPSSNSPKFQFNALNQAHRDIEFIPWLEEKSGEAFKVQKASVQTNMLLDHKEHCGFSQKLSSHLQKDPEFLLRLIMDSERNFIRIVRSRLILYLNDQQIATAIIKHVPDFVPEQNPLDQVDKLIQRLNSILSNGRSISTLLRNTEAKPILDSSPYFQIYQSDAFINRQSPTSQDPAGEQEESMKPRPQGS